MELTGSIQIQANSDTASLLCCPRCFSANIHHVGVRTFERAEDADTVFLAEVAAGAVKTRETAQEGSGNPSERRGGLAIRIRCEECSIEGNADDVIELTLAQHAGNTLIGWRYKPVENGE